MKDDIYNRFKKELSRYHRRGYSMDYPCTDVNYNEAEKENIIYIQLAMTKKGKDEQYLDFGAMK